METGTAVGRATVVVPSRQVQTDVSSAESASSVGTGRSGAASAYPFPSFPLVLSPQRAKSISTYAPQQQFFNHAPAAVSSGEYRRPHVVYSTRPSQGNKSVIVNIRDGVEFIYAFIETLLRVVGDKIEERESGGFY